MWDLSHNKNLKRTLLFSLFLIVIFVAMSTSFAVNNTKALGNTIYVATDGNDSWNGQYATYQNGTNGPKQTIKNATSAVNVNGQVYIADGQYKGTSNTGITIDHNMTITGESQSGTIIDGTGTNYLFIINNGVSMLFQNLTFINGKSTDNGGAIQNNGDLTIKNCTIQKNTAAYEGGGIYNTGNCLITGSIIQYNSATDYDYSYGGGIENYNGDLTIKNCIIQDNKAGYGCGIDNSNGKCTIINCTIQNNSGRYDGAISNDGVLIIINSTIQNNEAYKFNFITYGGGIDNDGTCKITNTIIRYNTADNGGGIYNAYGTCTITDSKVNNNIARNDGGGFYNNHATLNILTTNIQNNSANNQYTGCGGGIYNDINSNLVISYSKITANNAVQHGGGIDNEGNTWIDNTQCISGNNPQDLYGFGTLQIIHVRNERTNNCYTGLQEALDDAISDDTLILYNFIFNENIKINKTINLIGSGENSTFINGQGIDSCINIAKDIFVYIYGLTITNGKATNGSGIYNNGHLTLNNIILIDNHCKDGANGANASHGHDGGDGSPGGSGGAIYNTGYLIINNTSFINNTAGNGGWGGVGGDGNIFYTAHGGDGGNGGNGGSGGAIYNNGTVIINDTSFINNAAGWCGSGGYGGGSVYTYGGSGGSGGEGGSGGAIYSSGNLTIKNSLFSNNNAGRGGNGHSGGFSLDAKAGNGGNGGNGGSGGAIFSSGDLTISYCSLMNNTAGNGGWGASGGAGEVYGGAGGNGGSGGFGGAIYSLGDLTITYCSLVNNTAGNGGNGGYMGGSPIHLSHGGTGGSGGDAGAIYNNGLFNIENTILKDNSAGYGGDGGINSGLGGSGGYGGAIKANDMNITNCDFTNNTAMFGGAISSSNGTVNINKCNFLNNKAEIILNGKSMPVITINTGSIFAIGKAFIAFAKSAYGIYDNFTWGGVFETIGNAYGIYQAFQTGIYNKTIPVGPPQATGGAINLNGTANLILINSTFTGQNASWGGAIYNFGNGTTLNITGNTFTKNNAGMGGAIYSNSLSKLIIIQNLFKDNNGICGGAIFFGGTIRQEWAKLNATYNIFLNNTGYIGGVLYNGINGTSNTYINYNRIYGVNDYDIYNMYSDNKIDATLNWWDTCIDPGTYKVNNKCNIDIYPYLILVVTSNPNQPNDPKTITYGENTTITVDFLHNSNYYTYHSKDPAKIEPQDAIAFDGIPITFYIDNGGTILPVTVNIINGTAEVTYIANGIIDTTKLVKIYVYSPLENLTGNTTSTLINVNKIKTTTHAVYSQYKGAVGSNITLKAMVMDNNFNLVNEGNVIFWIGDKHIITSVLNGYAVCNWTIPPDFEPGNYSIYTTYNGTSIYASSEDSHLSTLTVLPSIYLTVTSKNNNPAVGDTVLYTIKVGNNGPNIAHDVVMTYIIPEGLEFVSAKVDSGSYSYNATTRVLTWNIGDVPIGDPHMWLYLRMLSPGNYIINPTLSSSNYNHITNVIGSLTINVVSQNKGQETNENVVSAKTATIGMQKTGSPIIGLIIAILMLLGGIASSKRR